MRFPKKEEYIYMDCSIRMSNRAMADLLYAVIMTDSSVVTSYGIGIGDYDRKQNAYNRVDIKIHIHPSLIEEFNNISKTILTKPIRVTINTN